MEHKLVEGTEAKKIADIAKELKGTTPADLVWLVKRCEHVIDAYSKLSSGKHKSEFDQLQLAIDKIKDTLNTNTENISVRDTGKGYVVITGEKGSAETLDQDVMRAFAELTRALQATWEARSIDYSSSIISKASYSPKTSEALIARTNSKIESEHAARLVGLALQEIATYYFPTQGVHMGLKTDDKHKFIPAFNLPDKGKKGYEVYSHLEASPGREQAKWGRKSPSLNRSDSDV
jgi:hypothetical protein